MYTAEDFNIEKAPKEMVQYVIDHVPDFTNRYMFAHYKMADRRPLRMADLELYSDIHRAMFDWALDNNVSDEEFDEFDIEEIFG